MFQRNMIGIFLMFCWVGCGAAATSSVTEISDMYDDDPVTEAEPASEIVQTTDDIETADSRDPKEDDTAAAATAFCTHEVEKSRETPPELLNKKQIQACLVALRPEIRTACCGGEPKQVVLKIIVRQDGTVANAFAVGDSMNIPEAGCIVEKVKQIQFPLFTSRETQVIERYPFQLGE